MNLPVADFIFRNPDWVTLPIQIWVGGLFLVLFLLSLRYGSSGAVEMVKRFRWVFGATLLAAAMWGIYGSIVLNGSPSG
jgi:uncharacterized membrane protein